MPDQPQASSGPPSPKARFPAGLVGFLVLMLAIEAGIASNIDRFSADIASSWRWSGRAAREVGPGSDILCLGDSLMKFGVVPRLLERETGRSACNLAAFQGNFALHYLLFRRAIDAGARPKTLIVDGELLYRDPLDFPWVWAEAASPIEAASLAWEARDARFFAEFAASWVFPSVRARGQVRNRINTALEGKSLDLGLFHALNWRNWSTNKGTHVVPPELQTPAKSLDDLERSQARVLPWNCDPINAVYLKRLFDLATARGVEIVFLLPPHHPAFLACFERPAYNGARDRFLEDLMKSHPNLVVVDARRSGYDRVEMVDLVHLNQRGSSGLSESLGRVLKAISAAPSPTSGPRWLPLPRFAPAADPASETIFESMMAVQGDRDRRRR